MPEHQPEQEIVPDAMVAMRITSFRLLLEGILLCPLSSMFFHDPIRLLYMFTLIVKASWEEGNLKPGSESNSRMACRYEILGQGQITQQCRSTNFLFAVVLIGYSFSVQLLQTRESR